MFRSLPRHLALLAIALLLVVPAQAGLGCGGTDEVEPEPEPADASWSLARSRAGLIDIDTAADILDQLQGRGVSPEPTLTITSPASGAIMQGDSIAVSFALENFAIQNSVPGEPYQHIHVILNNDPYKAHYTTAESVVFEGVSPGVHIVTAFLAREFHLALKNPAAVAQVVVIVGDNEGGSAQAGQLPDLASEPMIVYSRPKGTYTKAEAAELLCDFYLVNTTLADGRTVRATFAAGTDVEQVLTFSSWNPQVFRLGEIEPGTYEVKLELLDATGEWVEARYNQTVRPVTITP